LLHRGWKPYIFHARCWEYITLDRPANCLAWLTHAVRAIRGQSGGFPERTCGYGAYPYHNIYGANDDYFADWGQVPFAFPSGSSKFDATTQSTGYIGFSSTNFCIGGAQGSLSVPWHTGDRVLFSAFNGDFAVGTLPPSPLSIGVWYYVAAVDATNKRILISRNANLSSPITSYATTSTGVGCCVSPATCPTIAGAGTMNIWFRCNY
jgi:hypothetical protein